MEQNTEISEQSTLSPELVSDPSNLFNLDQANELTSDKAKELFEFIQTTSYAQNILKLNWINSLSSTFLQGHTDCKEKTDEFIDDGDNNNDCTSNDFIKVSCTIHDDFKKLVNHLRQHKQTGSISQDDSIDNSENTGVIDRIKFIIPNNSDTVTTTTNDNNSNNNNSDMSIRSPNKLYQLCNEIKHYQDLLGSNRKVSGDLVSILSLLNNSSPPSIPSLKIQSNRNITSYSEKCNTTKINDLSNTEYTNQDDPTGMRSLQSQVITKISNNDEHLVSGFKEKLINPLFKFINDKHTPIVQQKSNQHHQQPISYDISTRKPALHWTKLGVPQPATLTKYSAPVHIDVGGTLYTSSLQALTKYPKSMLGKMFNGTIPIVLDTMKQHYFIDRDGTLFRHVLNFLRTNKVNLDPNFTELDQLIEEANFYGLDEMINQLKQIKAKLKRKEMYEIKQFRQQQQLRAGEKDLQCTPSKQLKIDNLNENEITQTYNTISIDNATENSYFQNYLTLHQSGEYKNNPSTIQLMMWDNFLYIMLEMNKFSPHQGRIIFSNCYNHKSLKCFNDLNNYFTNFMSNSYQIVECEDHSEITWFMMSTYHQLKLWELLLNYGFELVTQYKLKLSDKNCIVCLFRLKQ
ncbi:unnamed protein product [Heterobilharzia americana]|nr:unnamed protein product [Heterobilharzia americana]